MDATDRALINRLHGGFPVCDRPFAAVGAEMGLDESEVIERIAALRESGTLTRFGPLFDATALGGAFTLCAMTVPRERFEEVAEIVDARIEVAHNYEREHALNMWFVLGTETPEAIERAIADIEEATGLEVLNLPKLDEYFLELRLSA